MTPVTAATSLTSVAVLLRGVNVGKAKRISSAELAAAVQSAGVAGVRTLLNSGNAVGESDLAADVVAAAVAHEVYARCGFRCDVIVRTRSQLEREVAQNPLADVARDPSRHLLIALGAAPSASAVQALADADVAPDQWVLVDTDLHTWLPNGVADSRLQKLLARDVLGVPWTGRNWSTIERILSVMP